MNDYRRYTYLSGRLCATPLCRVWSPTLTVRNPQIPNLPLETPSGGVTYFGVVYRWTGAAWVKASISIYNGATWTDRPVYRWTGAVWAEVDATGV